jgi:hypothetical protein
MAGAERLPVGETLGEAELERLLGSGASAARTLPLADLAGALRAGATA